MRAMPPRLARLLAAVLAIALVVGALVVRGALSGGDDDDATSGPGGGSGGGDHHVLCDEDLGEATCAALEGLDGVADVTVARRDDAFALLGEDARVPYDAWLTLDPLPEVLDVLRATATAAPLGGEPLAVASAPLAVLSFEGSPLACPPPITWDCLVEPLDPAVASPSEDTALGLVAAAAAAAGLMDGTRFGIDAFRADPARDLLADFLDEATSAGTTSADQTARALQAGRASGAVTIARLAEQRATSAQGRSRGFAVRPLEPTVAVGVVLAPLGPTGPEAVADLEDGVTGQTVIDALAEAGWDGEARRSEGLPAADVIYALEQELG